MKNIFLIIILFFTLISCNRKHYYVYSPNKKHCITIMTEMNRRYIINGKHNSIPKRDYLIYSLDSIDEEVGDEIVGHWNKSGFEWEIATDRAIIIKNELDAKKFKFSKNFPKDLNGNPTIIEYTDSNSFDIGFENGKIINSRGVIIQ